jgi:amidase
VQIMGVEGPMARCVADVWLGLTAMSGRDARDPWWTPAPFLNEEKGAARRVAVVVDPAAEGVHPQVARGVKRAAEFLQAAGYEVEETAPPLVAEAAHVWRTVVLGELLTLFAPKVHDIAGPALLRAFEHYRAAMPPLSLESYMTALAERRRILHEWRLFFERYALVVGPVGTEPPTAPDGDIESVERTAEVIHAYRLAVAVNALGLPAAVVPVGVDEGLPQVVQLIGAPFAEMTCLETAEAIERQAGVLTPLDPRGTS